MDHPHLRESKKGLATTAATTVAGQQRWDGISHVASLESYSTSWIGPWIAASYIHRQLLCRVAPPRQFQACAWSGLESRSAPNGRVESSEASPVAADCNLDRDMYIETWRASATGESKGVRKCSLATQTGATRIAVADIKTKGPTRPLRILPRARAIRSTCGGMATTRGLPLEATTMQPLNPWRRVPCCTGRGLADGRFASKSRDKGRTGYAYAPSRTCLIPAPGTNKDDPVRESHGSRWIHVVEFHSSRFEDNKEDTRRLRDGFMSLVIAAPPASCPALHVSQRMAAASRAGFSRPPNNGPTFSQDSMRWPADSWTRAPTVD